MTDQTSIKSNRLQGKVALVTGGASGIGEATALNFANHGAHAIVIGDVQDDRGHKVASAIGSNCTYFHCDVTKEDQVKSLVDFTVAKYGRLDIMFSNAGIISKSEQIVLDFNMTEYEKLFAVNVKGMAACAKYSARAMVEKGVGGSIIFTTSAVATIGTEQFTDYTMSKHAVIGLMKSASLQLGKYGIRVNSVSPGPTGTPLYVYQCSNMGIEEENANKLVEQCSHLKGRLTEKHLADAVLFLASGDSEFVTGLNLNVDGGYIHPRMS